MNKKTLLLGYSVLFIFFMGCKNDELQINAPDHMKSVIHQSIKDIYNCFKANNIPTCDLEKYGTLTVKLKPAEKIINGYPCFKHNGHYVAGIAASSCGSKSCMITLGSDNGNWNINVLKHELCHYFDFKCNNCIGKPHDPIYKPCCPSWSGADTLSIQTISENNEIIDIIYPVIDE